jgi:hypothetical protein
LTEDAWQSLSQSLELCHTKHGSPLRAVETILGWISQMGPCYLSTDINQAYARISELAHSLAFDEIPLKRGYPLFYALASRPAHCHEFLPIFRRAWCAC